VTNEKSRMKEPLLAVDADLSILKFPQYVSIKLDGWRCVIKDGIALTRSMKPFRNPWVQETFGLDTLDGLDGEICVGPPNAPDLMQKCGALNRKDHEELDATLYVFDYWTAPSLIYDKRLKTLTEGKEFLEAHSRVKLLPQHLIHSLEELQEFETKVLQEGYEGLIIRKPDGLYKYGRSTLKEGHLLKLKRWETREARITGVEEQYENTNEATVDERGYTKRSSAQAGMVGKGTLGAILGTDLKTGVPVRCGGGKGMTAKLRAELWAIREQLPGQLMTYEHFEQTGTKNRYRFSKFVAIRDPDDMSEEEAQNSIA
jgi:DNA ligase-1